MNYFGNYINFMTLDEYRTKHDLTNAKKSMLLQEEVVKVILLVYYTLVLEIKLAKKSK